ncbi:MAG: ABC transporter substrate-binding protein [Desulfamplus sp.]|nr:ABC transporter substrate-binding protein [Desulfamplus sp.]
MKIFSKMPMERVLKIFSILLTILLATIITMVSCSRNESPVVIGALLVLEGPAAFVGEEIRDGLTLAISEINSRGGINGHPLELVVEDAADSSLGQEADPAAMAFDRLQKRNPLLTVTCLSYLSMKIAPVAEDARRLMVALVATAPELTRGRQWVYRYWPTAEHEAPPMVDLFRDIAKSGASLGVIYLDDAYGASVYENLEKRCRMFGIKVVPAPFPISAKDFTKEARDVEDTAGTVLIGFDGHIIGALKALRSINYGGEIISTTTATLPSVTAVPQAQGVHVTAPAIYNKNFHFTNEIKSRYEKRFGKPFTQYSANGYDFIYVVAGLLEDRPLDRDSLKALLEKGFVYSGVFGNIELEMGKKDIIFPLFPARIHNGEIIYR